LNNEATLGSGMRFLDYNGMEISIVRFKFVRFSFATHHAGENPNCNWKVYLLMWPGRIAHGKTSLYRTTATVRLPTSAAGWDRKSDEKLRDDGRRG